MKGPDRLTTGRPAVRTGHVRSPEALPSTAATCHDPSMADASLPLSTTLRLDPALRRHRAAVAAAFGAQGLVFISLTTRLPRFADRWELGEVTLSLTLLMMVLLAGVGSVVAEQVARRSGSAAVLRSGLLLAAVAVPALAAAPVVAVFVLGLALYGVSLGLVDAGTNMQGVALEHRAGRPLLPSLHGFWTLGGVLGAAAALASADVPLPWVALLAVVPAAVGAAAPLLGHEPPGTTPPGASPDAPPAGLTVAWRPILLVGTGLLVFYTVDTAATAWGPLHLDTTFDAPSRYVALATFPYLVASGLVRLVGDRLVSAYGPVRVLRTGALCAAVGLFLVVAAPTWPVAVAGFTVVGAGVAVVAPLSFSAAARLAGDGDPATRTGRVDAVVARFNQFNYAGALVGTGLTGLVGAGSLRLGFALPMVLVLAILPLARSFAPARPAVTVEDRDAQASSPASRAV